MDEVIYEFVEAFVHSVLFARDVYPKQIFEQRTLYKTLVWFCVHPKVTDYIQASLSGLRRHITNGAVSRILITLLRQNEPAETVVLDLDWIGSTDTCDVSSICHLEDEFRALLVKISACSQFLLSHEQDVDDVAWRFQACVKREVSETLMGLSASAGLRHTPWIMCEKSNLVSGLATTCRSSANSKIVPIRSINTESVRLQCYIVESMASLQTDEK